MSRLWRYGSVYSRTRDFIVGKHNSWEDRPIWFDVWTKHPPRRQPVILEKTATSSIGYRANFDPVGSRPVPNLLYEADVIRAQYRRDFVDAPVTCLPLLRLDLPLSEKVTRRMNELSDGELSMAGDGGELIDDQLYHTALRDFGIRQTAEDLEAMLEKFSDLPAEDNLFADDYGDFEVDEVAEEKQLPKVPSIHDLLEDLLKNKMKLIEQRRQKMEENRLQSMSDPAEFFTTFNK